MNEHKAGEESPSNELIDEMNKLVKLVIKKQDESIKLEKQYETKLKNLNLLVEYLMNLRIATSVASANNTSNSTTNVASKTNANTSPEEGSSPDDDIITKISTSALDEILLNGLEYCVKDGKRYCMIPVISTTNNNASIEKTSRPCRPTTHTPITAPKQKKKKNKIPCSYCNETGHTRSKCLKRLQTEKVTK
ncbi:hypothetical protein ACO0QE_002872 [Hanseniaspora vineae]